MLEFVDSVHFSRRSTRPHLVSPFQSTGGSKTGGCSTLRSIKLSLIPRSHLRLLFWQFKQVGKASSHFRCRFLHVRHPVRTRFGLATVGDTSDGTVSLGSLSRPLAVFSRPVEVSLPLGKGGGVGPSTACNFLGLAVPEWAVVWLGLREIPASDTLWRLAAGISKWPCGAGLVV